MYKSAYMWVKEFSVSVLSKIKSLYYCNFFFEIMPINVYGKYLCIISIYSVYISIYSGKHMSRSNSMDWSFLSNLFQIYELFYYILWKVL